MRPRIKVPLPKSYGHVTTVDNATDSWVRFVMPSTDVVTIEFEWRYSGSDRCMLASSGASGNDWIGLAENGSGSGARTEHLKIDGFDAGTLTRDQLFDQITDGEWHTFCSDFGPANTPANSFASGVSIYFGVYFGTVSYNQAVDMRLFKVDVGRTGSWTQRSVLGNDNGFTRSNVTETAV